MGQKRNRPIELSVIYNEMKDDLCTSKEIPFGEGLSFIPKITFDVEASGGFIEKDGKRIGYSDCSPVISYEDGGFFIMTEDRRKKTYRYVDGKGNLSSRVFGKNSGPSYNGFARAQIIDENRKLKISKKDEVFTFAKKGSNGKLQLMKARFSEASFIDKCGLGRVVVLGEKFYTFVTSKGYVLPYRFKRAEYCSRDGKIAVCLLDDTKAYLCDNFDIIKQLPDGSYKTITTLKAFLKFKKQQKEEREKQQAEVLDVEKGV